MSKHTDQLLTAVQDIAEIIYMEMPLRYQDQWLENIMDIGIWRPDPEIVEGTKKEIGACCRNGCERCEQ
jgi:hypothetical protein